MISYFPYSYISQYAYALVLTTLQQLTVNFQQYPVKKITATAEHGQSVACAPEEPCRAAHSSPWCTLDTKLPAAVTEIKDP